MSKIHIKNMVCPRCIESVKEILDSQRIPYDSVVLGESILQKEISKSETSILSKELKKKGFELLEDKNSQTINEIKRIVIERLQSTISKDKANLSEILSEKLNHEYSFLSKLFSSVEGITIERFVLKLKIEKVKELLFYDELTLSEISYALDYSSVSHLSNHFKKETGMSPSEFKKLRNPQHKAIDSI